jgi:hypothetical protein
MKQQKTSPSYYKEIYCDTMAECHNSAVVSLLCSGVAHSAHLNGQSLPSKDRFTMLAFSHHDTIS